jgi:hypothetical protein
MSMKGTTSGEVTPCCPRTILTVGIASVDNACGLPRAPIFTTDLEGLYAADCNPEGNWSSLTRR